VDVEHGSFVDGFDGFAKLKQFLSKPSCRCDGVTKRMPLWRCSWLCHFLNLKMERVWQQNYVNHEEAIHDLTDPISGFCNSWRLHSALGYLPPTGYERTIAEQQSILVSEKWP
jgi:hypothetical protein